MGANCVQGTELETFASLKLTCKREATVAKLSWNAMCPASNAFEWTPILTSICRSNVQWAQLIRLLITPQPLNCDTQRRQNIRRLSLLYCVALLTFASIRRRTESRSPAINHFSLNCDLWVSRPRPIRPALATDKLWSDYYRARPLTADIVSLGAFDALTRNHSDTDTEIIMLEMNLARNRNLHFYFGILVELLVVGSCTYSFRTALNKWTTIASTSKCIESIPSESN